MITAAQNYFSGYSPSTIGTLLDTDSVNKTKSIAEVNNDFSSTILSSSFSQVTISTFGSQINQIYNKLNSIEDDSERNAAQAGLRSVLLDLVETPDNSNLFSFISTANRATETDVTAFQAIFGGGTDTNEIYSTSSSIATNDFVDLYGQISNSDLADEFSSAGLSIITGDGTSYEKQQAYNTLLVVSGELLNADLSDDEYEVAKTALFNGLAEAQSLSESQVFLDEFSIEKIVEATAETQAEDQAA